MRMSLVFTVFICVFICALSGGELDPHGADGNGNPIGGLVFGNSFGNELQYHEWTSFISDGEFCFRACVRPPSSTWRIYALHLNNTLNI